MDLARLQKGIAIVLAASVMASWAVADELKWRHGMAVVGEPELPADFKELPYVDVNAPKAGELKLAQEGTFDNLNPVIDRGAIRLLSARDRRGKDR